MAQVENNGDGPLTLIHFGDLHVWNLGFDRDFAFKRLLGLANLILRRGRKFPPPLAQMLIERLGGEEADYVVFTGDLTTTALRREFIAGRQLLGPVIDRWERRFIAIPGNHDRYTPRAADARLFENHFHTPHEELPFAHDLDPRWTLVAFDCAVPRRLSSRGRVAPETLARLDALLAAQRERGRDLIAAAHYPLHYPEHHKPTWEHVLPERAEVLEVLHRHGVRVYLHGHAHHRWCLEEDGMIHLNCGSSGLNGTAPARRPGYLKISLGAGGAVAVEMHWLAQIPHNTRRAGSADWLSEAQCLGNGQK